METAQFINVLHHFSGSTAEDAEAVLQLKNSYPFSQLLHTLSARVSQDHGFTNCKTALQLAAVYAADRAVLKEIMELEFNPASDSLTSLDDHHKVVVASRKEGKTDVAEQVLTDLEKLNQARHNFEMLFVDGGVAPLVTTTTPIIIEQQEEKAEETAKDSGKTRKERIRELAKTYLQDSVGDHKDESSKPVKRSKKKDSAETLMNDLESKEELVPESEKHKEQLDIINQFIRIQPSLVNLKDKEANTSDLSTIKTGEFGDNIISETLVEILLKQGKKEKAVEVLKKLIWKFPQKKAYFAAQIEELRK